MANQTSRPRGAADRTDRTEADTELAPMLEELRANFDRALNLDIHALRERLSLVEAENQALRGELTELRAAVGWLRQIASEHESRLQRFEGRRD